MIIPNNVSIKQLLSFVTVAEQGSFTAAANELHLTQSTLTTQIKQLEANVGLELFDRTTRSVQTTSAGESFLPVAKRLLSDFKTAIDDLSAQAQIKQGHIKLASSPSMLSGVLPALIKSFRTEHEGIHFLAREESAGHIENLVHNGSVDFGIGGNHSNLPDLTYHPLLTDQYGIVSSPAERLTDWRSLEPQQLIWLSSDTGIRNELERLCEVHHLPLDLSRVELEVSSPAALAAMVSAGLGASIIPALAASTAAFDGLTFLPLERPRLLRTVYLIQRLGRSLPPASQLFIEKIKQQLQQQRLPPGVSLYSKDLLNAR